MPNLIDLMHLGRDRVIGAYEVDGVIVDPGPASCLEALLAGLEGEPRVLLLTHIHLDHAGASGSLVARFPDLRVYVHEVGAPHLVDPQKLLDSASRLYGDDMERLWGEVVPVPASSVVALSGGEEIEGFRVAHVPGHANHHVAYLHRGNRRRLRRGRGRRTHPSARVHVGADAAAGHRRRGVGALARDGRRMAPATTLPDPLRPRRRDRPAARAPAPGRSAPTQSAPAGEIASGFWPRWRRRSTPRETARRPRDCARQLLVSCSGSGSSATGRNADRAQPETLGYPARTSHGPSQAHKTGCRSWRRRPSHSPLAPPSRSPA